MITMEPSYKQKNQCLINNSNMYLGDSIWLEKNIKSKDVKIEWIPTKKNLIDPFKMASSQQKHDHHMEGYDIRIHEKLALVQVEDY
jgi:hypothetical protein